MGVLLNVIQMLGHLNSCNKTNMNMTDMSLREQSIHERRSNQPVLGDMNSLCGWNITIS